MQKKKGRMGSIVDACCKIEIHHTFEGRESFTMASIQIDEYVDSHILQK